MSRKHGRLVCLLASGWLSIFGVMAQTQKKPDVETTGENGSDYEEQGQMLFKTDTIYTLEENTFEAATSLAFWRARGGESGSEIPISLVYGLTDAWQVEMGWTAYQQHNSASGGTVRGIGDLELSTQYSFINVQGSLFHVAAVFSIGLPLGNVNQGFTDGFIRYRPAVIMARDFPGFYNAQLFAELGTSFLQRVKSPNDPSEMEPAAHELQWSLGGLIPVGDWVISGELSGNNSRWNHQGTENQLYLTPGVTWKLSKYSTIGLGVPMGLNKSSDKVQVILLFTYQF